MRKHFIFMISMVVSLIFCSCDKDLTALDPALFKCNPNPLEVKSGKVDATIIGKFPVKYFSKNATLTVTPVLKFAGKEVKGTPSVFQGEKVKSNNKIIIFKAGGSYTMKVSFDYVPEMSISELYLNFEVATSKKTYTLPSVKVADGVIATSQLVSTSSSEISPAFIADKFVRQIQEMQDADILFMISKADLKKNETSAADVVSLVKKIKELKDVKEGQTKQVSGLEVSGYASPDGSLETNEKLADKREKIVADFLGKELKKIKQTVKISAKFTAEDWEGFKALMEKSTIQDKELILRVLSMNTDPEQREREIKNLSAAYKNIAEEILPQLRRSKMKLMIDVVGKSDAELLKAVKSDSCKLTVEEILFAGTLTSDLNEKAMIYQKATTMYPSEMRAFNSLGYVKLQQENVEDASRYFTKALTIDAKNADANYNAGITALAKGEYDKAEDYFGKAAGTSGNLNQALGTLYMLKGDYAKSKTYLGAVASNNAALLQILNGDFSDARKTLANVAKPDAMTAYLGAILGARTTDREAVFSNLRIAVKRNPALAQKALKDIEFSKFSTEPDFSAILK
jgi:tetratricopeptide (TPR) repeat protein